MNGNGDRDRRERERGQAVAEFAVCLPVLITILCAILDFGWIYLNQYELVHACSEAARYAALHGPDAEGSAEDAEQTVRELIRGSLSHPGPELSITVESPDSGSFGRVSATNPVPTLTYVGGGIWGETCPLQAASLYLCP